MVESSRREWVSASVVAGLGRRHADGDADVVAVSSGRPVVDPDLSRSARGARLDAGIRAVQRQPVENPISRLSVHQPGCPGKGFVSFP